MAIQPSNQSSEALLGHIGTIDSDEDSYDKMEWEVNSIAQTANFAQSRQTKSSSTTKDLPERLDAMSAEIQEIRQIVQALDEQEMNRQHEEPRRRLADELWGSLGQGSPEEFDYEIDINLYRLSDDPLD